jgi:Spy/CpxP family protein refolding chaperone
MGKRTTYSRMRMTARILILALASGYLSPTSILLAQQDGPPPDFQGPPPGAPMELESVKKQLARMTHRYGLTPSQQEAIGPLLEDERQKTRRLMEDTSRPVEQKFAQAKGIHEDAAEKIASLLTDTQKAKYKQDEAKRAAREERDGPGMQGGPPPGDGGPPPPP